MDQVPPELFIAPVPLVALVGLPHLHSQIAQHLIGEQTGIKSLSIPNADGVSVYSGKERRPIEAKVPPPVGILKSDWLSKHQKRSPAVFVVLLDREMVYGNPTQWLSVCSDIDKIKAAARNKNIKIILLSVQSSPLVDINDERFVSLRKRGEIEQRNFLLYNNGTSIDLKKSLRKIHSLCVEIVDMYYMEEGRRMKLKIERKAYNHAELTIRYHFKVAVYCEFIRDWTQALRNYELAYDTLLETYHFPNDDAQPVSSVVETKAIAELLNLKILLLLLNGAREGEAIQALKRHVSCYLVRTGPKEAQFLHWEWMGRQYRLFAELLEQRLNLGLTVSKPKTLLLADREFNPGLYFQFAAENMGKWRTNYESALDALLSFSSSPASSSPSSSSSPFPEGEVKDPLEGYPSDKVLPPLYIGQFPRIMHRGNSLHDQRPSELEFLTHELLKKKKDSSPPSSSPSTPSHRVIELWVRAQEHHKRIGSLRCAFHISYEIAKQYFHSGDCFAAKQHLESCIQIFRKERCFHLLHACLSYLRLCAKALGLFKEYVFYSIELISLPFSSTWESNVEQEDVDGMDVNAVGKDNGDRRGEIRNVTDSRKEKRLGIKRVESESIHVSRVKDAEKKKEIFDELWGLLIGKNPFLSEICEQGVKLLKENPFSLRIDPSSPFHFVMKACVAFHDKRAHSKQCVRLFVSLLTNLPHAIDCHQIQLLFDDSSMDDCVLLAEEKDGRKGEEEKEGKEEENEEVKERNNIPHASQSRLKLFPRKWNRFSLDVIPAHSGRRLECTGVLVHVSDSFSIRCMAESYPPPDYTSEQTSDAWEISHGNPFSNLLLNLNGQRFVEIEKEKSLVDLSLKSMKVGIVGERIPLLLSVSSKGHCIRNGIIHLSISHPPPSSSSSSSLSSLSSALADSATPLNEKEKEENSFSEKREIIPKARSGGHGINMFVMREGKAFRVESNEDGTTDIQIISEKEKENDCFAAALKLPFVDYHGGWRKKLYIQFEHPSSVSVTASLSYFHGGSDEGGDGGEDVGKVINKEGIGKEEVVSLLLSEHDVNVQEMNGLHKGYEEGEAEGERLVRKREEGSKYLSPSELQVDKTISIICEENFDVKFVCSSKFREHFLLSFDDGKQGRKEEREKEKEHPPLDADTNESNHSLPVLPSNKKSVLSVTVSCLSSIPLRLLSLQVVSYDEKLCTVYPLHSPLSTEKEEKDEKEGMKVLRRGDTITSLFFLLPLHPCPLLEIGKLQLGWKRESMEEDLSKIEGEEEKEVACESSDFDANERLLHSSMHNNSNANECKPFPLSLSFCEFSIPPVTVQSTTLFAKLDLPPYAILGDWFQFCIKIFNESSQLEEVSFTMMDSSGFVFHGSRSGSVFVLPKMHQSLTFHAVAISSGDLRLPLATLRSVNHDATLTYSTSNSSIFVYPTAPEWALKVKDTSTSTSTSTVLHNGVWDGASGSWDSFSEKSEMKSESLLPPSLLNGF